MPEDQWVSFNVREDYLKNLKVGSEINTYIPALDIDAVMKISYIKDIGDYAAWKATKQTGQYDLRTFELRAIPLSPINDLKAGMTVLYKINEKQ